MADQLTTIFFEHTAKKIVQTHDHQLLNDGPDEQATRALEALRKFDAHHPLEVAEPGLMIDLAGFGSAPVHYMHGDDKYLLLSEITESLGWNLGRASEWARLQCRYAIEDQRDTDEDRGDGRLGWECLGDYCDLNLDLIVDDPQANPDANGKRWTNASDFLISTDRIPLLLSSSPWGREFMNNTMPAFGYAMRNIWGDKLKDIPTYTGDGTPTGGNAHDGLFTTGGLSEEEALKRARRGPSFDTTPEA